MNQPKIEKEAIETEKNAVRLTLHNEEFKGNLKMYEKALTIDKWQKTNKQRR